MRDVIKYKVFFNKCAWEKMGKIANGKWKLRVLLTFSCLKKHSIFSSRKTRLDETKDWNTFGSFLSATRRPSRGSVTALWGWKETKKKLVMALKMCLLFVYFLVFSFPRLECICCWDSLLQPQKEFENLLSINVERNKRGNRAGKGEREWERDRQQANKQTANVDCVVCLARRAAAKSSMNPTRRATSCYV